MHDPVCEKSSVLRRIAITIALAGIVPLVVYAPQAAGCTPPSGVKTRSNLEQVQISSSILVGRVLGVSFKLNEEKNDLKEFIYVSPVKILKGYGPKAPFLLDGFVFKDKKYQGLTRPSRQDEFELPHIGASIGGCNRGNFVVGELVLFMLQERNGLWEGIDVPFSRWAEDVATLDAPWVQLVQIYLTAGTFAKSERKSYLTMEKQKLLDQQGDRIARLMAEDIDRQITGKSSYRDYPVEDYPSAPFEENGSD